MNDTQNKKKQIIDITIPIVFLIQTPSKHNGNYRCAYECCRPIKP